MSNFESLATEWAKRSHEHYDLANDPEMLCEFYHDFDGEMDLIAIAIMRSFDPDCIAGKSQAQVIGMCQKFWLEHVTRAFSSQVW